MGAAVSAAGLPSRLGKYELLMPLAAGGMARIYIGRATGIGSFERHVVLKLITQERANDVTAVNMFLDEARLAASLHHQNVAQVFAVGEEGGIHYLAMEYVHGQDLRAVLARAGAEAARIPIELALTVVAGAAAGLHHAHERRGQDGRPLGIVHRDVSPSNVMIGYDGAVKVLDFGIAKAASRSVETQSGIIKGKFAYMSPEQCRGREVDRRSDVFSLGILLFEATTQHRCFRADSDFDTMHRIVTGDVVRPSRLNPSYPPGLEAIVLKALSVDPADRYQSAGELLEAIEQFAAAARIPLSTMGLGRFMRDMFGDVEEPWLATDANLKVDEEEVERENTVSSTGGHPGPVIPAELVAAAAPDLPAPAPSPSPISPASLAAAAIAVDNDDEDPAALTILDPVMDPGMSGAIAIAVAPGDSISQMLAPAEPPQRPSYPPSGSSASSPGYPHTATPNPAASPGSGPVVVSTRHGYASGAASHAGLDYPRYEPPPEEPRPAAVNRRPLFIGGAIVVVGLIVILMVSLGGGKGEPEVAPGVDGSDEGHAMPGVGAAPEAPPSGAAEPAAMVAFAVSSRPSGATVSLDGARLGTTPFVGQVPRDAAAAKLTVHLDGYQDFTATVTPTSDYRNETIELRALVKAPAPDPAGDPSPAGGDDQGATTGAAGDGALEGADAVKGEAGTEGAAGSDATATGATGDTATAHGTASDDPAAGRPTARHIDPFKDPGHGKAAAKPTPVRTPAHRTPRPRPATHGGATKPRCQPPGQLDPFDTSCGGKPCPPCK